MSQLLFVVLLVAFGIYALRYYRMRNRAIEKAKPIHDTPAHHWTTEFLESKRQHTDPIADNVVKSIMAKGESNQVNRLFGLFSKDDMQLPTDLPPEVYEYFEKTAQLPPWADADLIAMGQQVYIRHGVLISILLSYKALPECYANAKGAMVLFHTARLNEQHGSVDAYARRISETAQFVLYAMSPNGLSPEGRGIRATQKVRLIHAVIRYYIRQNNWDAAQFGEPINQEDMAGTLMSFSALILEGLELLNVVLSDAEKEAYIHCWRIIGHILGLDADLIPNNAADALSLGHAILDHQIAPSEQGKSLTTALLTFQHKNLPSFIDAETNLEMMHFMIGENIAEILGLPPVNKQDVEKLAHKIRRFVDIEEILDHTLLMSVLIQGISKLVLQAQINQLDKNQILNFYIPESLTKDWGVSNNS